jgi:hypothetical protein
VPRSRPNIIRCIEPECNERTYSSGPFGFAYDEANNSGQASLPKLLTSIAAAALFAAGFAIATEHAARRSPRGTRALYRRPLSQKPLKKSDRLDIGRGKECHPNQVVGQHTSCSTPADQTPISPQRTVGVVKPSEARSTDARAPASLIAEISRSPARWPDRCSAWLRRANTLFLAATITPVHRALA